MDRKRMLVGVIEAMVGVLPARSAAGADREVSCSAAWQIVPSPSPGTNVQALLSVSAVSSWDAWAVGFAGYTDEHGMFAEAPLIEHWDGSSWNVSKLGEAQGLLDDIEVVSPDDVWAVGRSGSPDPLDYRPLVLLFDGVGWTEVPSPQRIEGQLTSISAASAVDIWAAGMEIGTFRTVIEHWDGKRWTTVPHPSPRSAYVNMGALEAVSSDDAWLVGSYLDQVGTSHGFAEHWDGATWTRAPVADGGADGTALSSVWAAAPNDVWASGTVDVGRSRSRALIEHWDGFRWEAVRPERAGRTSSLGAVSGGSSADIWTVGTWSNSPDGGLRTLIQRSSGTAFTISPSPNANDMDNLLLSVSESPDGDVWAVGFYQEPGINRTLAMRSCP